MDKQKRINNNLDIKLEEIENKIEELKLTDRKVESLIENHLYRNEIICKYEINDIENYILLFNYEDKWLNSQEEIE